MLLSAGRPAGPMVRWDAVIPRPATSAEVLAKLAEAASLRVSQGDNRAAPPA